MRLIDRSDIELWAKKIDSKSYLPVLISRLVKAVTPISTFSEFPSGSAANVGGWDGIVNCQEDCGFVPRGISLWEFGTEATVNKKAGIDYTKRSSDPLGYNPKDSTFVFVTPRFWKDKDTFKKEKLADNIWADIRVYDSRNLEEWLDDATAVSRWYSQEVGRVPNDGVITTEEFWKEWAYGPSVVLSPAFVTTGRERESQELFDFLSSDANIKGVKASTKDEAIAFIIASAKQFEKQHQEHFFSKTLVIDKEHSFRAVRANRHKLNLIAKFEDVKILYAGVVDGHHVLVPLGADDPFNNDVILLPDPPRDGQVSALISIGIAEEESRRLSRESARNLTVLKRLLKFPQNQIEWLECGKVEELIPALIIGRWNEANPGDVEIIEMLSGVNYSEYQNILYKWRDVAESPIIQIGHTWRLTSPLDAWSNVGSLVKSSDFEKLKNAVLQVLKSNDPEDNTDLGEFSVGFRPPKKFSRWSKEGLLQSLILIGLYGEGLKLVTTPNAQQWVDQIIDDLFNNADGPLWVSLDHELPLIAEASPTVFLERTNQSLLSKEKAIMAMFASKPGLFIESSCHTGLLWALEGLAWIPEYFLDAVLTLARIAKLKPKINMVNQPINSLREIFKSWHFQTLAGLDERMTALQAVIDVDADTGWMLLLSMLPTSHGTAHPTHSLRWRLFGKRSQLDYTYDELFRTHSIVIDLITKNFNGSEEDLACLVDRSDKLSSIDRKRLLDFVGSMINNIESPDNLIWSELGKTLSHHRSHPTASWALQEEELIQYEELYKLFEPVDPMIRYIWLFNEHWPQFPEGINKRDSENIESHAQKLQERRLEAVIFILDKYGIEKFKELGTSVKEPWILGQALASVPALEIRDKDLSFFLNSGEGPLKVIQGYFAAKARQNPAEWSLNTIQQLSASGLNHTELIRILSVLDQNIEIWSYIENKPELASKYWRTIRPFFYRLSVEDKQTGLINLLQHKRFLTAIDEAANYLEEMPTPLIVDLLTKAATEKAEDDHQPPSYEIGSLFETLYKRSDIEKDTLIRLEWLYLEVLDQYRSGRSPQLIQAELLKNPEFFIEIIKWVYMPNNKDAENSEASELASDQLISRATRAYRLLRDITKVPGMSEDETLDADFLVTWIVKVRELAAEADRIEVTDSQIGQILAQYPEDGKPNWPPEPIARLIEEINTESLKSGFSSATFNKRGSSTRGSFDGGDIERHHAEYFESLSANYRIKFPNLAMIFTSLANGYRQQAKYMDDQANRDRLDY